MSEPPVRILRDTFCTEDRADWAPHGCGGIWRRRQTDGILRRNGVEPVNLEAPLPASLPTRLLYGLRMKRRLGSSLQWTRRSLSAADRSFRFYRHNARRSGLAPVALLESGSDPVAVAALKDEGFRVVAVLEAIHSLWRDRPNPFTGSYPSRSSRKFAHCRMWTQCSAFRERSSGC